VDDIRLRHKMEVIVVNDGSTDKTKDVAEQFKEEDPDLFRVVNKENGGHGSGINTGIRLAEGRYFKVVDADDWVDTNALEHLLQLLEKMEEKKDWVDIVATDFITIMDESWETIRMWPATSDQQQYGRVTHISKREVSDCIKMHHMTIRTAILKEMGIAIDEHCFYVDMEYITYPIPYADTVYFMKETLYQYRLGRAGQTMDTQVMIRNRERHSYIMEQLLNYYKRWEPQLDEGRKQYMALCIGKMMESHFQIYLSMKYSPALRQQLKNWDQGLRKQYPLVYAATNKKSIWLLRETAYRLLGMGGLVYRITRKQQ
jgi:glycosyltransferase involved in cell wall biosynthesis